VSRNGQRGRHLTDLTVEQVTLFCLREDGFAQELRVLPVSRSAPGLPTVITPEVRTIGGIAGTRRPGGAAWRPLTGQDWTIQLEDTDELTASFQVAFIWDIVLVLTVVAAMPAWPCAGRRVHRSGCGQPVSAPLQRRFSAVLNCGHRDGGRPEPEMARSYGYSRRSTGVALRQVLGQGGRRSRISDRELPGPHRQRS
jgi:hypothetical protein